MAASSLSAPSILYNCFLHGTMQDDQIPRLVEKLKCICGINSYSEINTKECYFVHFNDTSNMMPSGTSKISDENLVRLQLDLNSADQDKQKWTIWHSGIPEPRFRDMVCRPVISTELKGGVGTDFVELLGFRPHFEYIRRGHSFIYNNYFQLILTRGYEPSQEDIPLKQLPKDKWSVELVSSPITAEGVPKMKQDIDAFTTMMLGTLALSYGDHLLWLREEKCFP